jgi:hypothetical protein
VAQDQNQTAAELSGAELQAANHRSFRMWASVSGVPKHENVTWTIDGSIGRTKVYMTPKLKSQINMNKLRVWRDAKHLSQPIYYSLCSFGCKHNWPHRQLNKVAR